MGSVRLTEKTLAAIVPPEGVAQLVVRDAEQPGLIVVVGARTRTFYVETRIGKRRTKIQIGRHGVLMPDGLEPWNVTRARQRARELLGQVAAGKAPGGRRSTLGGPTLLEGLELHLESLRRRKKSPETVALYDAEIRRHLADWLDRPITALTSTELDKVHAQIRKRAAAAAKKRGGVREGQANLPGEALANRVVRHVGAIWNTLDRREELPGRNPRRGVEQVVLDAREARIPDGEFAAWYAALQRERNPIRRDLFLLGLLTGVRSDGLRHLRWDDLDAEHGLLQITHAKGGRGYTIPVGPRVLELLAARRADNLERFADHGGDQGWIFPGFTRAKSKGADGQLRRQVVALPGARARDKDTRATIGVPLHDLRRTFNSIALEVGVPVEARNMLMNHERRGVNVKHYSVPQNWTWLAEQQARIEAAIWERITATPPGSAAPLGRA